MNACYTRLGAHVHITCAGDYTDTKHVQKFISAIQGGDVKTLHKIPKKEFDVNALFRFESGMEKMSALHYATKEGKVEVARVLLQHHGCDVNILTPFDVATPLMFACRFFRSDVSMVSELLKYGADVNKTDHVGKTPLIAACELGCLELVRLLIDSGAEINHTYKEDDLPDTICQALRSPTLKEYEVDEMCDAYRGNGPLLQAAREHHYPVVQELIHRGCDLQITNTAGNTALHIACHSESKTSVNSPRMMRSPIAGSTCIVKCLLEAGCDINRRNKHGETPLRRAIGGISELVAWNIPVEHKVEEAKTFCDIIQILVHYGCYCGLRGDVLSPVSLLLKQIRALKKIDSFDLQSRLSKCLHMLVSAGCPVKIEDVDFSVKHLPAQVAMFLKSLYAVYPQPGTLKQLCKLTVRQYCSKPIGDHMMLLGLPLNLCDFVALEILD